MFNQIIESVQNGQKQFVNTFVTDKSFQTELIKLVDAQAEFAKNSVDTTLNLTQAFAKNFSNSVYPKKGS